MSDKRATRQDRLAAIFAFLLCGIVAVGAPPSFLNAHLSPIWRFLADNLLIGTVVTLSAGVAAGVSAAAGHRTAVRVWTAVSLASTSLFALVCAFVGSEVPPS